MEHSIPLISTIAAALGLALVFGFLAVRLKLPALVGYLAMSQHVRARCAR